MGEHTHKEILLREKVRGYGRKDDGQGERYQLGDDGPVGVIIYDIKK